MGTKTQQCCQEILVKKLTGNFLNPTGNFNTYFAGNYQSEFYDSFIISVDFFSIIISYFNVFQEMSTHNSTVFSLQETVSILCVIFLLRSASDSHKQHFPQFWIFESSWQEIFLISPFAARKLIALCSPCLPYIFLPDVLESIWDHLCDFGAVFLTNCTSTTWTTGIVFADPDRVL